jgi:site-specific DNA-methyltransferase (adenine-specific)
MSGFTLALADAFSALPKMEAGSVDALITDPPYSSGGLHVGDRTRDPVAKYEQSGQRASRSSFGGDQKDQRSWTRWTADWLRECFRVLKPGAPFAIFTDWRQLPALSDAVQFADLSWRGVAVWDKTEGTRPCPGRPRNQSEYIVWGSKGPMSTARQAPVLPGVHREPVKQDDKHHLTGKPVGVMRWLVRLAEPSSLILDPFAGSGTTGVAALLDGHTFVGFERDEYYHGIALRRLEAARSGCVLTSKDTSGGLANGGS